MTAHLLPAFGPKRVDAITTLSIETWRSRWLAEHNKSRQAAKLINILHAVFERAKRTHGLSENPAAAVERLTVAYDASAYDFYSVEEVAALVRAAASSRTGFSSWWPRSLGCGEANCSRCDGATWTSNIRRSESRGTIHTERW